jgi:hypothetical protein
MLGNLVAHAVQEVTAANVGAQISPPFVDEFPTIAHHSDADWALRTAERLAFG